MTFQTDNIEAWFWWYLIVFIAGIAVGLWFAYGIKPYNEGPPPKRRPTFTDHIVCGVHGCHNPADGIHQTRHIPMCDRCAQEINAIDGP